MAVIKKKSKTNRKNRNSRKSRKSRKIRNRQKKAIVGGGLWQSIKDVFTSTNQSTEIVDTPEAYVETKNTINEPIDDPIDEHIDDPIVDVIDPIQPINGGCKRRKRTRKYKVRI